jgi:hypothetical protein
MIGKSLTRNQMVALLRNMGTIDQPWVSAFSSVFLDVVTGAVGDFG